MFYYWGFGFIIRSEIEFPELDEVQKMDFSLNIKLGSIPEITGGIRFSSSNFLYIIHDNELIFTVNNIARYYAKNGNEITVEILNPEEDSRTIRLYILATVMAAIVLQNKQLSLHASAIILDNQLLVMSGDSGVGKSTLLASLLKKGYSVFSDDILVLSHLKTSSEILATASYPMIKLWEDSIVKLNNKQFGNRSFKIRYDIDKYGFFFHNSFDKNSYPIATIIILKKANQNQFTLVQLKDVDAFWAINKQVYRPFLIQSVEQRTQCFRIMTDLVKNARVVEITRPQDSLPDDLLEFVEDNLQLKRNTFKL